MKHLTRLLLILGIAGALASCESSTSPKATTAISRDTITSSDRVLFVASEGQFGSNNSSLDAVIFRNTFHIHDSGSVHDTVRAIDTIVRTGSTAVVKALGEANDLLISGKTLVVLDNGGNSLHFVNADSLTQTATMSLGLSSPNKMALVGTNQIIVTERADSVIPIIDINTHAVVKTIKVGKSNAAVGVLGGNIFATISEYQKPGRVVIASVASSVVTSSLPIGSGPETLLVDSAHNQVIVSCSGDYKTVPPAVYFIDGTSLKIKDSIVLGSVGDPVQCFLGDKLYEINGGAVVSIDLGSQTIEGTLIQANGTTPYYNGYYSGGNLYLGVSNFAGSSGKVNVFDAKSGQLKWSFTTGIAPAHFAFYH